MTVGRRAVVTGLVALYVVAWMMASLVLKTTPSDLDLFFWPSAETVVAGHPLLVYSAQAHAAYPNANGPLGLLPLVPLAALANALGWAASLGARAALTGAMVSAFALLLACQVVQLVVDARGAICRPLAACPILLAPALWIGVIDYGHIEQPLELCLVLFAVRATLRDRPVQAGIALGAAVLARSIAVLCAIPFAVLPLATRRLRPAATMTLAAIVVVAMGLAPFVIADAPAAVHSLVTYRGSLPIGGGSFWVLARQTSLAGLAQHGDAYLAAAAATRLAAITLRRRPVVASTSAGMFGLLTVAACCFPLFAKTVFPYYLLEPYVFSSVWWLARPGTARTWRALVPLLLTIDVFVTKAATLPGGGWAVAEGVASSAILALVVALVVNDLFEPSQAAVERHLVAVARATGS